MARDRPLHPPAISIPRRERAPYELPPAALRPPHARLRVRGARSGASGLPGGGAREVPVLLLWRRDARDLTEQVRGRRTWRAPPKFIFGGETSRRPACAPPA